MLFAKKMPSSRVEQLKTTVKFLLILVSLIFIFRCIDRDRLNPIDPRNPITAGRLQQLNVYSEQDRVVLQWRRLSLNNIRGYRIYRKIASDSTFQPISLASPDSSQYIDYPVIYNNKYDYFVSILGGDFETPGSDTVSIIPGPTSIWATDVYNRRLLKISHDGTHEIRQIPVDGYPWALAYDSENNIIWYTDVFLNRVYQIKSPMDEIVLDLAYGDPIDLVMDKKNNRIWIADQNQGRIFVFNRQGEKIGEIGDFKKPASIDCVANDGSCWIADSKAGTITKISTNLNQVAQISHLINPTSISANQQSGDCWVADSSRVLKFDLKGRLRLSLEPPGNFLRYLAIDSELGHCWVLDFNFFAYQSRLLCFNNDGDQLLDLGGLSWPENLKVNPYDHSCIVADAGAGRILKVLLDGTIIGEVTGYDYPRGLFIEF